MGSFFDICFWSIFILIQLIFSIHLLLPFILLTLSFFVKSRSIKFSEKYGKHKQFKFGVIVTAYQETKFIKPIIDSILKQSYTNYEIYVVADDCDITHLKFCDKRIHILRPDNTLSSNTRSIQYAIENFDQRVEVMVLFDPDNLLHPEFLQTLNNYYNAGYKAVQGNLCSKNCVSAYEQMDSVGTIFYNFIDREARSLFDFSVNIWGCGVSVLTDVYKKISYDTKSDFGGFDKHMQSEIAQLVPVIGYASDAIFYDEKISDGKNLENQRTRWINAYFNFLSEGIKVFFKGIKEKNLNLAFFGLNLVRPPYFLQLIIAMAFVVINIAIHSIMLMYWGNVLLLFAVAFVIIILYHSENDLSKGLFYMPLFFFHQVRSLLKLRLNKTSILKTEHFKVLYIDDILKNEYSKKNVVLAGQQNKY